VYGVTRASFTKTRNTQSIVRRVDARDRHRDALEDMSDDRANARRRASCGGDARDGASTSGFVDFLAHVFARIAAALGFGSVTPTYELNETQRRRLHALALRACVAYDARELKHADELGRLWRAAFAETPPPKDLKSERWKEMGWQGTSPETDFRAGGFLALENLVRFAERDGEAFHSLMLKKSGARSEFEYPFAVAGVNLTFNLVELCEVKEPAPATAPGVCFAHLIEEDEDAFQSVYELAFQSLDREWLAHPGGATYMDFPSVWRSTKSKLSRAMSGARTMSELKAALSSL